MKLSSEQIAEFAEQGYVFLPNVFSAAEVQALMREVPGILRQERQEVVREKDGKTPRTAFAVHTYNDAFGRLARHPRLIEPVEQLLGGPVYIHQFKINAKAAFDGDVWQWHQDYGTWQRDDDMPEARAMNIALFLDDVTEFNGPLMFIPRSHKRGVLEAGHDVTTTSLPAMDARPRHHPRPGRARAGSWPPRGRRARSSCSTAIWCTASPSNLSPWDRTIVYISACHVDNHIRRFKRPEWIAHRDFTPIQCLPDDCLLQPAAA